MEESEIYQIKIRLKGSRPPIWRRILIPSSFTFWELHVAIQDAMGWEDAHLHEFEVIHPVTKEKVRIGIPDKEAEFWGRKIIPEREEIVGDWLNMDNRKAIYIYDFGDNWVHNLLLEKVLEREKGVKYPVCTGGKRACPPEDCGGIDGYYEMLEAIKNPEHEMHEEWMEWAGNFDPDYFDEKNGF